MEILENREAWAAHFTENWLAHYEKTGETDFKQYQYTKNDVAPSGKAIDLSQSKLLYITSSGAYLKESQTAYDAENPLGDYTTRLIPQSTALDELAFAHTHYNHKYVDEDPQALVPLRVLDSMQADGLIGELAENIISFHGYTPDVRRILDELAPQVVGLAKDQQADAALLVPA